MACDRDAVVRGRCNRCYQRFRASGGIPGTENCSTTGCAKPAVTLGRCSRHYGAFKRTGDELFLPGSGHKPTPIEDRFFRHVDRSPGLGPKGDCEEWTGTRIKGGYGRVRIHRDGRSVLELAHRVAWELKNGPVPKGMVIRHIECDNPPCVREEHLAPGTDADNAKDMWARGRAAAQVEPRERDIHGRFKEKVSG